MRAPPDLDRQTPDASPSRHPPRRDDLRVVGTWLRR
jgi:hypothetical protein